MLDGVQYPTRLAADPEGRWSEVMRKKGVLNPQSGEYLLVLEGIQFVPYGDSCLETWALMANTGQPVRGVVTGDVSMPGDPGEG